MRVVMEFEHPEDVRVTLTCTMTVAQWQVLDDSFGDAKIGNVVWDFRDAIRAALHRTRLEVVNKTVIKT